MPDTQARSRRFAVNARGESTPSRAQRSRALTTAPKVRHVPRSMTIARGDVNEAARPRTRRGGRVVARRRASRAPAPRPRALRFGPLCRRRRRRARASARRRPRALAIDRSRSRRPRRDRRRRDARRRGRRARAAPARGRTNRASLATAPARPRSSHRSFITNPPPPRRRVLPLSQVAMAEVTQTTGSPFMAALGKIKETTMHVVGQVRVAPARGRPPRTRPPRGDWKSARSLRRSRLNDFWISPPRARASDRRNAYHQTVSRIHHTRHPPSPRTIRARNRESR